MPVNNESSLNYWMSCIKVIGAIKPSEIIDELESENIEAKHILKPMHMQPLYAKFDYIGADVAKRIFEQGVCLPSDTKMTDDDLMRVVSSIKGLWNK